MSRKLLAFLPKHDPIRLKLLVFLPKHGPIRPGLSVKKTACVSSEACRLFGKTLNYDGDFSIKFMH